MKFATAFLLTVLSLTATEADLRITIYDRANLKPGVAAAAIDSLGRILRRSGIAIQVTAGDPAFEEGTMFADLAPPPVGEVIEASCRARRDIALQVLARAPHGLGPAIVGLADPLARKGLNVVVFDDRIRLVALRTSRTHSDVLAHVIAHEIGHVLLRTTDHAKWGLMSEEWGASEFTRMPIGALIFTRKQTQKILATLRAEDCAPSPQTVSGTATGPETTFSEVSVFSLSRRFMNNEHGPDPIGCSAPFRQSESAYQRSAFPAAEKWLRQALACQEAHLPPAHPELAISYERLAELKRLRRDFGPAEALFKRALAIWSADSDRHLADRAEAHNGLAVLYYQQRRYRDAETEAREALEIAKLVLDDAGFTEATVLNTFGFLFGSLGDTVTAEKHYRSALVLQKAANRRDLLTFSLLHSLASVRNQLGFETEAQDLFREALALHQELLPARHPQLTKTVEAYVKLLKKKGMKEEVRRVRKAYQ